MKYQWIRLLFLLALCPIFASRTVAQDPYDLITWACAPTSCSDDAGPTENGFVETIIGGTCINGFPPSVKASAFVSRCSAPYLIGSHGQTVNKLIEVNNTMYADEGLQATSGIWDSLGEEVWFSFAYQYCDRSSRTFSEIDNPC
jgi:hypothetical protein